MAFDAPLAPKLTSADLKYLQEILKAHHTSFAHLFQR